MMTNLFSSFDPCTGKMSLNWMSTFIMILIMPMNFWVLKTKSSMVLIKLINQLSKEMNMLMNNKESLIIIMSLFLMILINNMMGLIPYIFTSSSHLLFSLSMSLPLWFSFMLFGWINYTKKMFIHLVPMGTPSVLMPFMVLIETISNIIRPGSLAVRLTANMIAGHMLMALLGSNTQSMKLMSIMMFLLITLMVFEMAVSMIQAYVFMTLTTLYSSEI
nr:ATP synthase F0 subunit 6 [Tartessus sp.]